jgi:hypothetical protein
MEPLLYAAGVDVMFHGHVHAVRAPLHITLPAACNGAFVTNMKYAGHLMVPIVTRRVTRVTWNKSAGHKLITTVKIVVIRVTMCVIC